MTTIAPPGIHVWGNQPFSKVARPGSSARGSAFNRGSLRGASRIHTPTPVAGKVRPPSSLFGKVAKPTAQLIPNDAEFNVGILRGNNRRVTPTSYSWTAGRAKTLMPEPAELPKPSAAAPVGGAAVMDPEDLAAAIKMALETAVEGEHTDSLKSMLETVNALQLVAKKRPLMESELDVLREVEADIIAAASAASSSRGPSVAALRDQAFAAEQSAAEHTAEGARAMAAVARELKEVEAVAVEEDSAARAAERKAAAATRRAFSLRIQERRATKAGDADGAALLERQKIKAVDDFKIFKAEAVARTDNRDAAIAHARDLSDRLGDGQPAEDALDAADKARRTARRAQRAANEAKLPIVSRAAEKQAARVDTISKGVSPAMRHLTSVLLTALQKEAGNGSARAKSLVDELDEKSMVSDTDLAPTMAADQMSSKDAALMAEAEQYEQHLDSIMGSKGVAKKPELERLADHLKIPMPKRATVSEYEAAIRQYIGDMRAQAQAQGVAQAQP